MPDPWPGSSLRRLCAPTGVALLACLTLASAGLAAAPAPDPPPLQVAPEPAPTSQPAAPAPVQSAKPKPKPAARVKAARVVKPKAPAATQVARPPHDRNRVPLAVFVSSVDSIHRDLLAIAGFGLLLVALGGAVVLLTVRRQLREFAL